MPRGEAPWAGPELPTLAGFLDHHRATLLARCEGLSSEQLGRRAVPTSELTLAGLLKHLAYVEDDWFQRRFSGVANPEPWRSAPWDDDPDWEFHSAPSDDADDLRALYVAACERSRAVYAGRDLTDTGAEVDSTGTPLSLRWLLLHMVEETARHNGHADLLREAIDGVTGA